MKNLINLSLALIAMVFLAASCSEDSKSPTDHNAADSDFQSFRTWTKVTTKKGADPALGGMAHGGNDENVTRNIFIKKDVSRSPNGEYPIGTIIVKESLKGDGSVLAITAMVKRESKFNPQHKGWEWFMLAENGNIGKDANGNPMRGANLMDGMCNGCHAGASNKDYVFTK